MRALRVVVVAACLFPTAAHQNLMAWTVQVAGDGGSGSGCYVPPNQNDSATDGDLDIAFALLLADKQWPGNGYLARATTGTPSPCSA